MSKKCTECGSEKVREYEYGGYKCYSCNAWFTSKEFGEMNVKAKLNVKSSEKVDSKNYSEEN